MAGGGNDVLHFKLSASRLDRKDLFGGADPYLEIQRAREVRRASAAAVI